MSTGGCGCVYCRRRAIPSSRIGWKILKNRKGFYYGTTKDNTKGSKPKQRTLKAK